MNPLEKSFKIPGDQIKQLIPNMGACFATDRITVDGMKVGYMYREEPDKDVDSGWRFFSGDESQDYGQALLHWTMVSLLEPDAVDATLYAGRCQAQLGQVREALATFDLVRRHPGAEPALRQQAEQMLALLQQRRVA